MSIFRVFVDDEIFYHPAVSSLAITQAEVTEQADAIDSLKLSAPKDHPYIDSIIPLQSLIVCKKDDRVVFQGRAVDDGTDFYNTHTWTCESCLAWLKDTYLAPFDYQGPLKTMLEQFIEGHNKSVEQKKQFQLGTVTVQDGNDYIHYASQTYINTMSAIQEKLIETHGGYLVCRTEDGVNYLDYLADFSEESIQNVEYAKNLLDVTITRDHSERVSALIPFGAITSQATEVGQASERLDISSVNSGFNYVFDQDTVDEIGWIWTTEAWDDVTVADHLLTKAQTRLAELKDGVTSMELSIIDESDTEADIGDIHARQYVNCRSDPHGINGRYLVLSKTTDYLHPANNKISIGAKGVALSKISAKQSTQGPQGDPGSNGSDAFSITIQSSNGTSFQNTAIATTLSAHVYKGGTEVTGSDLSALGTISWYKDGGAQAAGTGPSLVIEAGTAGNHATYLCELTDSQDTVKSSAQITLVVVREIKSYTRFYQAVSAGDKIPDQPTVDPPPSGWADTEPAYDGTEKDVYFSDRTEYTDGSFSYSPVSMSSAASVYSDLSKSLAGTNSDLAALKDTVRQTSEALTQKADEITAEVSDNFVTKTDLETIKTDIQSSIDETGDTIRMEFKQTTDAISGQIDINQNNLEEYIRFKDGTIELGKVGNAFMSVLSNEELAFTQSGAPVAYISDNSMKITDAHVSRKLSLGQSEKGWFDFVPRTTGNLSMEWRGVS